LLLFRRGPSITSILNVGYRLAKRQRDYQKAGLSLEGRESDERCGVTNLAFSFGGVLTKEGLGISTPQDSHFIAVRLTRSCVYPASTSASSTLKPCQHALLNSTVWSTWSTVLACTPFVMHDRPMNTLHECWLSFATRNPLTTVLLKLPVSIV